jgi:hypothetical protein
MKILKRAINHFDPLPKIGYTEKNKYAKRAFIKKENFLMNALFAY